MQISPHIGSQLVDLCSALTLTHLFRHRGAAAALRLRRPVRAAVGLSRPDGSAGGVSDREPSYLHRGGADRPDQSDHHPAGPQEGHRASQCQTGTGDERQRAGRPADLRRPGHAGLLHHATHHPAGLSAHPRLSGHRTRDRPHRIFHDDRPAKGRHAAGGLSGHGERVVLRSHGRHLRNALDRGTGGVLRRAHRGVDRGDLYKSSYKTRSTAWIPLTSPS